MPAPPLRNPNVIELDELSGVVSAFADRLRARPYRPSHVLYIDAGGRLLGLGLSQQLGVPCSGIAAKRHGGGLKRLLGPIVWLLPRAVTHELRRLELSTGVHRRTPDRDVMLLAPLDPLPDRILVVDDAVDTGHSLKAVVDFLRRMTPRAPEVLTASVTMTSQNVVIRPDIVLCEHLLTFPWSPGSVDYARCSAIMNSIDAGIEAR